MFEAIKSWYNNESNVTWYHNKALVAKAVVKGLITAAQYKEITGEDYPAA